MKTEKIVGADFEPARPMASSVVPVTIIKREATSEISVKAHSR
jgi:hypothetical protein